MTIRPIEVSDLPAIRKLLAIKELLEMLAPTHLRAGLAEKWLGGWPRSGDRGVVALNGQDLVGACWFRRLRGEEHIPELIIGVHPKFQGRRIGQKLLDAIVEQANDLGLAFLQVATNPKNERIQRLLEHYNFRVCETTPEKIEGFLALDDSSRRDQ